MRIGLPTGIPIRRAVKTYPPPITRMMAQATFRMRFVVESDMHEPSHLPGQPRIGGTPNLGAALGLLGRDAEFARIHRLVADARQGRAGALLLIGEAGIGKTALLDAAEATIVGFEHLRTRGVSSESAIPFGALLQLLAPLRRLAGELTGAQRDALELALGWGDSSRTGEHHVVGAATLALLAAAAEERPLLLIVDDFHWVDRESASALLFAARRLTYDRVAVLAASRAGPDHVPPLDGLEIITLQGLTADDAAMLFPTTAPTVVYALVRATGGNPLALRELCAQLTPAQHRGSAPLPHPISSPEHAHELFAPLLERQSPAERQTLHLVAASLDERAGPVRAALLAEGRDPEPLLDDLQQAGLLVLGPGTVDMRHPLLRAAVWAAATPGEQRAAHLGLAQALTDDRRARVWHRAQAAGDVDDELADELEALAADERRRIGHSTASAALVQAARLTSSPARASLRLAAATEQAALAGDLDGARQLAQAVVTDRREEIAVGRALAVLGAIEQAAGSIQAAASLLEDAVTFIDEPGRVRVLADLAMARYRLDDIDGMGHAVAQIGAAVDQDDPHHQLLRHFWEGMVAFTNGDQAVAGEHFARVVELSRDDADVRDDPTHLVELVFAAGALPLTPDVVTLIEGRLANARRLGALAPLVPALTMVAHGRVWLGDYAGAFADVGEAVELAAELGVVADGAPAFELLAWHHASRGLHDEALIDLDRAAALVERAGTAAAAAHLALARAYCALCRNDHDEIVALLEARLEVDGGRGERGEPLGVAPLLVEAYAATGQAAAAGELAERYIPVAGADGPTGALAARCQGLVEPDHDRAVDAFTKAVELHIAAHDWAFETARTELMLGARLRRAGWRRDARTRLRSARNRFSAMELTLWEGRCVAELAATGETRRQGRASPDEPLTAQETRIAQLVAEGLTNAEVAAALFVSPKTVEHHLSTIYRKRGVRGRTELTRSLLAP